MIKNIENSNQKIQNICSNTDKRQLLLKNTMKRIDTTLRDGVELYSNRTRNFVQIDISNPNNPNLIRPSTFGAETNREINTRNLAAANAAGIAYAPKIFAPRANADKDYFNVIFDTGNSSVCLIDISLVLALNLTQEKTFPIYISGVTGAIESYDHFVNVRLKFDPNKTNFDIAKEFHFKAYVKYNGSNQLLLGQNSLSLKKLFDESYCIGYDETRIKYVKDDMKNVTKLGEYENLFNEVLRLLRQLKFSVHAIQPFDYFMQTQTQAILDIDKVPVSQIASYFIDTTNFPRIQALYNLVGSIKIEYDNFLQFQSNLPPNHPYNHTDFKKELKVIKDHILNCLKN